MKKIFNQHKIFKYAPLGMAIFCFGGILNIAKAPEMNVFSQVRASVSRFPKQKASDLFKSVVNIPEPGNRNRFNQLIEYARSQKLYQRPIGEIIQAIAEQFLGTPYISGLLDKSPEEKLIISFEGFDCVLFVETVLAIARSVAIQDYTYSTFANNILNQRYRHGKINGYCSRLHYFSDWIYDNHKRGNVTNITPKLGGIPLLKTFNFMSNHRENYPLLASNDANYQCLRSREAELEKIQFYYLPKNKIYTLYSHLKPGDIVATTTDIKGLDVTHTGFIYYYQPGGIGFIHASPSRGVTISRDLQNYLDNVEGVTGIIVARPNTPHQIGRQYSKE